MTELNLFKEFAICSVDELRDEEIRIAETTSFCLSEKSIYSGFVSFREDSGNCRELSSLQFMCCEQTSASNPNRVTGSRMSCETCERRFSK